MSAVAGRVGVRALSSHRWSVITVSLLTLATIFGAFLAAFWILENPRIRGITAGVPQWQLILIRAPIFVSPFFVGGGLWGLGLARLTGTQPVWPTARAGALTVGGLTLLLQVPVHMSQALPVSDVPFGFHILFTSVLMTEVSLVAGVGTARTTRHIPELGNERRIGLRTGISAAVGFLAASIIAFPLGWEVRVGNGPGMISSLYLGIAVSSITAGAYLGHRFHQTFLTAAFSPRSAVVAS